MLDRFAKAAGAGEMLNIHDIKAAYEKAIGHETSNSRVPFIPNATSRLKTHLKNGFPNTVRKARRAAARRGHCLRIMFADEARFGRINRPRPCWAPIGTRPEVASQLIREYIYLYGTVCPKNGTCVYLIMPTSNTACFQAFLDILARKFARQDILLVLDGAPNHRCGDLALPDNISLLFLPPYSPELNPKENLWDEIREKIFKKYALKSINAVRAKLKQAILYIERIPKTVKSITSFPYIVRSL